MAVIITRAGKGSPLTNAELDANFNNINAQLSTAVITGGTIDGATIGATTATTGKFSQLDADNLRLDANTISSTDTNGNITITPNGTGAVAISKATVISVTDNTNAALRITQLGTGNALLVEDSSNPDATPFVINASGTVLAGTTVDASTQGATIQAITAMAARRNIANVGGPAFRFEKSRATTDGTYTIVQNGDALGDCQFYGADGVQYILGASVKAEVDGTPGTNDMPGRLVFSTTADGASTVTERMRIDSSGNVGIGTTNAPVDVLQVVKALATTGTGIVTSNGFTLQNTNSTVNNYTTIQNLSSTGAQNAQIQFINVTHGSPHQGVIAFSTRNGVSDFPERMRIDPDGDVGIGTTTPTSLLQTAGTSAKSAFKTPNIAEVNTVSATAATGTINYDVTTQSVLYYTTNASGNFTVNFRGSSGTTLNTVMQTGESISATFLVTNGTTAYYNSAVQVDGSSVTPKWQGGTAPTSGNASSIDSYTYVIIKTGSAAFTVLASVTKFA